jgi:hypothetical protein
MVSHCLTSNGVVFNFNPLSPNGTIEKLYGSSFSNTMKPLQSGRSTPNPYTQACTPSWGVAGRTHNPYTTDKRMPVWNALSQTPNLYTADSGKTPAWNVVSQTPNPYVQDGGQMPACTPNSYGGSTTTGGWNDMCKPAESWGGSSPGWSSSWVCFIHL